MINELYSLAVALRQAGITLQPWHRKYKPIPNVTKEYPCFRFLVANGTIAEISNISPELGSCLRRYGDNNGAYPCMNLFPLFRITDKNNKDKVERIKKKPETLLQELSFIENLCSDEANNWLDTRKIEICLGDKAKELAGLCEDFPELQLLCSETAPFVDTQKLHSALKKAVFEMLNRGVDIPLALKILFHPGDATKSPKEDRGKLSVAFDSKELIDKYNISAVSNDFVLKLNNRLLNTSSQSEPDSNGTILDAFGNSFVPDEEKMPNVKLAGGFDVTLRTMFKDHRCQKRYDRIESASYPLSQDLRTELATAMNWIGAKDNEQKHWIKSDTDDILFVYPYIMMPNTDINYTSFCKRPPDDSPKDDDLVDERPMDARTFSAVSKKFLTEVKKGKKPDTDGVSDKIQLFVLRKLDKARRKVVYSRLTDPVELEKRCEDWTRGISENLPYFFSGTDTLEVPFPLDIVEILNKSFKQNGDVIEKKKKRSGNKEKTKPSYHGLELLLDPETPITEDLHNLAEKAMTIGPVLGTSRINRKLSSDKSKSSILLFGLKDIRVRNLLVLMGLLLYRKNIKKENYMANIPYCYGQLLKVSDELHALYCRVVRGDKDPYPPQFVGGSLFQSAAEQPLKTLNMLSQRINPYYVWAKSYRLKNIQEKDKESWRARRLYSLYEELAANFKDWTPQLRFNDEERAQFFIGYLASLKQDKSDTQTDKET